MTDLFVYYKVRDEHAAELLPRVTAMQASLAARHGVAPQLKRRPQAVDGWQTWMEVYPGVSGVAAAEVDAAGEGAISVSAAGVGAAGVGVGATSVSTAGVGAAGVSEAGVSEAGVDAASAGRAGEGVGGNFEAALAAAVRAAELAALAGTRHTEVFMDMISCA